MYRRMFGILSGVCLLALLLCSCADPVSGLADGDIPDGDGSEPTDGDSDLDPALVLCFTFCDRAFECDRNGGFGEEERELCRDLCPDIGQTCVTRDLLRCAELARCDAYVSCVTQAEINTDCEFPVQGKPDGDSDYRGAIELPGEVSFGAVVLGQRVERKVRVGNRGGVVLELYDLLVADNPLEFRVVPPGDYPLVVAPGDGLDISVLYSPQDAGRDEATLLVYSSDPLLRVGRVTLSSDYKGLANARLSPTELNFGTVALGGESAPRVLRIRNESGSPSDNRLLTVLDLRIQNEAEGAFNFAPDSPRPPFYVVPGGNVEVSLVFSPHTWGLLEETLLVVSDSHLEEEREQPVSLSGTGAARRLCVNPDPILFGSVRVGTVSSRLVELEACGTGAVQIDRLTLSDTLDVFSMIDRGGAAGTRLEVGERASFRVEFTPTTTLPRQTLLVVESDDLFFPVREVVVSGQGAVSNLVLSPPILNFDNVGLQSEKTLSVNLRNIGVWPVAITGVETDLADSPFSLDEADTLFPLTLNAGEQQDVTVRFHPQSEASYFDNLTFLSNNSAGNVSLGLSGRGTAASVHLSRSGPVFFENVPVGGQRDIILTVSNTGRAPLRLDGWGIVETPSPFRVNPPFSPLTLGSGVAVDLVLRFVPEQVGEVAGTFYIESDDTDPSRRRQELDLVGLAIDPVLGVDVGFPHDFGQVFVGARGGPLVVTLTNEGVGPLLIHDISHDSAFDAAFLLVAPGGGFPVLLRPSTESEDRLVFLVTFVPPSTGSFGGLIRIDSSDLDRSPRMLQVGGSGATCPPNFYNCDGNPATCEYECHGNPNAPELCNGQDDNCNCQVDEGFGVGQPCAGVGVCGPGVLECHPGDPTRTLCSTHIGGSDYRGTAERCNGLDDDCDGFTDEDFSVGQPCVGEGTCGAGLIECRNAFSTRCSTERGGSQDQSQNEVCDGQDNDCDGLTDEDFGVGLPCSGVGLCQAGVWECKTLTTITCSTLPGGSEDQSNPEICDGQDNDCDGLTDEDWEIGYLCLAAGECGIGFWECDTGSTRRCSRNPGGSEYPNPAPVELCDGRDNDCDGFTDEDYEIGQPCDGQGECGQGLWECRSLYSRRCSTDIGGSEYPSPPPIERCDGLDNNCNGLTDEAFAIGVACTGEGECGTGVFECASPFTVRCSTDIGGSAFGGTAEICDGRDNDCNGLTDEIFDVGTICDGQGECGNGIRQCDPGNPQRTICSSEPGGTNPQHSPEQCDGLDNDCDGYIDNVCRASVYRFSREAAPGNEDHRLGLGPDAPAGFSPNPAGPLFGVYTLPRPGTLPLVQLTRVADPDTIYTTDPQEVTDRVAAGWSNDGVLGYVSELPWSDSLGPLYRLVYPARQAHIYTADEGDYFFLLGAGWEPEGIEGYVWHPTP